MAFFDSSISRFSIDDTAGTQRDLSACINHISGIPGARTLVEVTTLSDDGRRYIAGFADSSVTIAGVFDDSATDGADAVLGPLLQHASSVAFSYGPAGTSSNRPKYSGKCWVEKYEISSSVGAPVGFTATLRVDGSVTRGTY